MTRTGPSLIVSLLMVIAIGVLLTPADANKLKVVVYYETLCPFCLEFIGKPLKAALSKSGFFQMADIQLVPYGFEWYETVNGKIVQKCHHGPEECYVFF